ncbi:hypothetical protein LQ640_001175 [Salmonella enterica subsp. enterica serovar Arechavaleta]|nr:hypothetical protein [Salmonella enterica subsp. enterica serovar Arechavaleta]EJB1627457.1 hypothetical protein [Salmonella enterica]
MVLFWHCVWCGNHYSGKKHCTSCGTGIYSIEKNWRRKRELTENIKSHRDDSRYVHNHAI